MHRQGFHGLFHGRGLRFHLQLQSVIGELHVRVACFAQAFVGSFVAQIMSDVREPRPLWFQLIDQCQRLLYRLVHRVWNIPQRVHD